jgi:hypothetical protein
MERTLGDDRHADDDAAPPHDPARQDPLRMGQPAAKAFAAQLAIAAELDAVHSGYADGGVSDLHAQARNAQLPQRAGPVAAPARTRAARHAPGVEAAASRPARRGETPATRLLGPRAAGTGDRVTYGAHVPEKVQRYKYAN